MLTRTWSTLPKRLDEKSGPHPDCEHVPSTLEVLLAVLHFVFSSGISVRSSCRNFGASIITLVLPPVLYFVMDPSGTSVRSAKVGSRTSRRVVHSPVHHDGYAYVMGLRIVFYTTLRRLQRQLLRQRVQTKILVFVGSAECHLSAPCRRAGGAHRDFHVCVQPCRFLNRQFQHQHFWTT